MSNKPSTMPTSHTEETLKAHTQSGMQYSTRAYISLGSNMGDSEAFLQAAREAISQKHGLSLSAASAIYRTEPQGMAEQNWFYNQVIAVDCLQGTQPEDSNTMGFRKGSELCADAQSSIASAQNANIAGSLASHIWTAPRLLQFLLDTETRLGRTRSADPKLRFGPRCIDLDILLFGQEKSTDPLCTLPHPRLWQRAFVLVPLRHMLQQKALHVSNKGHEWKQETHNETQEKTLLQTIDAALATLAYSVDGNCIYQNMNI